MATALPSVSKQNYDDGESDLKKEKPLKTKGRRFSKTISLNFGERNQITIDSL